MTSLLIITFCLGCCVGMIYTYIAYRVIERKHRKKDEHSAPNRKRLVYGGQKGLDSRIARLKKSGWKVIMTQICYQARGKKVYIAELEKQ